MDRGLKAAFLFSLLVVAQADRALLAHKANGGGLHAVAVLRSTVDTGAPSAIATESALTAVGNYMITNGNGTWTYSYYANNGNLNSNDAGMGGDYGFANGNLAFFNSNAALGTLGDVAFQTGAVTMIAPSFDDAFTVGGAVASTQIESPVAMYTAGITSVAFTGSKTGIAVGRFNGMHDQDQITWVSGAATALVPGFQNLNILLTYDGATTWVRATGVPKVDAINSAIAANLAASARVAAVGTATVPPYPQVTPGDLTSVFFASKTLGWAVGGNAIELSLLATTTTYPTLGPVAADVGANAIGAAAAQGTAMGLIIMTMNGGSLWKVVPIYISAASLTSLWINNDPSLKTIFDGLIPGILFGVQSDASGKHVYAVGSPGSKYFAGAAPGVQITANTNFPATAIQVKTYGTILYSGNSGMSWVQQTAPTLYSGLAPYVLFAVAVQKGTTAIAVGGSASDKYGDKAAGTIIYTMNGGFSWTQAVYPQSTGSKAPAFTCVALQPAVSGVQAVWVGGFTVRADIRLAGNTGAREPRATDFYPVAAVAGYNPGALTTTVVSSGVPRSKGQIYTILVSKDGGKTFAAAPTSGLPTGYVVTSYTLTGTDSLTTDRSVYGITWDNAMHGWIYGYGYIMSTQNGGATWVYETPSDVGVLTVTPKVLAVASVPTTY